SVRNYSVTHIDSTHSLDGLPAKDQRMIHQFIVIDGSKKLPEFRSHAPLMLQHGVPNAVVYKPFEHGNLEIVWLSLKFFNSTRSMKLLVITNKNEVLDRWETAHNQRTFKRFRGFFNEKNTWL